MTTTAEIQKVETGIDYVLPKNVLSVPLFLKFVKENGGEKLDVKTLGFSTFIRRLATAANISIPMYMVQHGGIDEVAGWDIGVTPANLKQFKSRLFSLDEILNSDFFWHPGLADTKLSIISDWWDLVLSNWSEIAKIFVPNGKPPKVPSFSVLRNVFPPIGPKNNSYTAAVCQSILLERYLEYGEVLDGETALPFEDVRAKKDIGRLDEIRPVVRNWIDVSLHQFGDITVRVANGVPEEQNLVEMVFGTELPKSYIDRIATVGRKTMINDIKIIGQGLNSDDTFFNSNLVTKWSADQGLNQQGVPENSVNVQVRRFMNPKLKTRTYQIRCGVPCRDTRKMSLTEIISDVALGPPVSISGTDFPLDIPFVRGVPKNDRAKTSDLIGSVEMARLGTSIEVRFQGLLEQVKEVLKLIKPNNNPIRFQIRMIIPTKRPSSYGASRTENHISDVIFYISKQRLIIIHAGNSNGASFTDDLETNSHLAPSTDFNTKWSSNPDPGNKIKYLDIPGAEHRNSLGFYTIDPNEDGPDQRGALYLKKGALYDQLSMNFHKSGNAWASSKDLERFSTVVVNNLLRFNNLITSPLVAATPNQTTLMRVNGSDFIPRLKDVFAFEKASNDPYILVRHAYLAIFLQIIASLASKADDQEFYMKLDESYKGPEYTDWMNLTSEDQSVVYSPLDPEQASEENPIAKPL